MFCSAEYRHGVWCSLTNFHFPRECVLGIVRYQTCMIQMRAYFRYIHTHIFTHTNTIQAFCACSLEEENYTLNIRSKEHNENSIKKEGRKGEDGNYYGQIIG